MSVNRSNCCNYGHSCVELIVLVRSHVGIPHMNWLHVSVLFQSTNLCVATLIVTRPTASQIVEASSRTSIQAMAGSNSLRQSSSTRRYVAICDQTRSFWSDATVPANYAMTTIWHRRVIIVLGWYAN